MRGAPHIGDVFDRVGLGIDNVTELEPIDTTASVRLSGEKPIPCTST
jgi:hypothetical protein